MKERSGFEKEIRDLGLERELDELAVSVPTYKIGNEKVRWIQTVLNAAEGERLAVDGDLESLTRGALERFRKKYNLGSGGVLDDKTQLALAQRAIEEIRQQSLFGQFGVLDAATRRELRYFKSEHGLGVDDSLDAATRSALTDALEQQHASAPNAPVPVANPQQPTLTSKKLKVTANGLNVRNSPSKESGKVGSLYKDDIVDWLDSSKDGQWYKVQKDSIIGWSFHRYFTLPPATSTPPATPTTTPTPTPTQLTQCENDIIALVQASPLVNYNWPGKSVAPIGYLNGITLTYARVYCKLKASDPVATRMAQANSNKLDIDALAVYDKDFTKLNMANNSNGSDTLRHLFVLLTGLGMRESDGRYCLGRDKKVQNPADRDIEAGVFQMSYSIGVGSSKPEFALLKDLYNKLQVLPYSGYLNVFMNGAICKTNELADFRVTAAGRFREFCVMQPALGAEIAALGLRIRGRHWGPINEHTVTLNVDCDSLFKAVQAFIDGGTCCVAPALFQI